MIEVLAHRIFHDEDAKDTKVLAKTNSHLGLDTTLMAKLRHIAFISPDPKRLSDFYQKHFALEEIKVFPSCSRMVIDGLFNLAFVKRREIVSAVTGTHRRDGAELDRQPGIHHSISASRRRGSIQ